MLCFGQGMIIAFMNTQKRNERWRKTGCEKPLEIENIREDNRNKYEYHYNTLYIVNLSIKYINMLRNRLMHLKEL